LFENGLAQDLQDFVKAVMFKMQAFLRDRDQDIRVDCNSDLSPRGDLARAPKRLDSLAQLWSFEEQLHRPTLTAQSGHEFWLQGEVTVQKRDRLTGFPFDNPQLQNGQVVIAGVVNPEYADVITDETDGGAVPEIGEASTQLSVVLGMRHDQHLRLINRVDCVEVKVSPIRQVQPLTQADRAGVEPVDRSIQFDPQRFPGLQGTGQTNQVFSKVGEHSPWTAGICIDQFVTPNGSEPKTYVVQPRKVFNPVPLTTPRNMPSQTAHGQIGHQPIKHERALLLACLSRCSANGQKSDARHSSRDQSVKRNAASKSSTEDALMRERWDTTDSIIKLKIDFLIMKDNK
jgi:hypothetical protein